ncbi:hypothetical protein Y710_00250 [Gordonia sp. QH-12]|nr:hypothetical protein Y710_00250 [Gordonia sp. QH-12]
MTTPARFVEAFPPFALYDDPGWISVHKTIEDRVYITRSCLIRETDPKYVECLQHVGDRTLELREEHPHHNWWIGSHVIVEVWS